MLERRLGVATVILFAAVIGALTLRPEVSAGILPYWCFKCGALFLSDWILNAVLFLPFGFGVGLAWRSPAKGLVIACVFSVIIELAQRYVIPGRYPSLGDITFNSLGGLLGALAGSRWRTLLVPRAPVARRLAILTTMAWLSVIGFCGWAMYPSLPKLDYWGQLVADLGYLDAFPGRLIAARLGDQPFPPTRIRDSYRVRELFQDERAQVAASVLPGRRTSRVAPVVSMFTQDQQETFILGQAGGSLIVRLRRRASDAGLWSPDALLDNVFSGSGGGSVPIVIHAQLSPRGVALAAWAGSDAGAQPPPGAQRSYTDFGPALGWSLLLPANSLGGLTRVVLTMFWLALLAAPGAYWWAAGCYTMHSRNVLASRRFAGPALAAILIGLGALPWLQGVHMAPVSTWLATIAAVALSAAAAMMMARKRLRERDPRWEVEALAEPSR